MRSHVICTLILIKPYCLFITFVISIYKIKIALGEFDIRCLCIVILRQYSVSYPPSRSPLFTLPLPNYN